MKSISFITLALIFALSFFGASNSVLATLELGSEAELTERFEDNTEEDVNPALSPTSSSFEKTLYAQHKQSAQSSCTQQSIPHCPYHSQAPPTSHTL